jgi:predicted AlkP superfamily pyrophosphatase or phosphodiesterase
VLFAVDGLEWSVVLPLLESGRMPTLARLMERGSYGRLYTIQPTLSPVIWTTIATARRPAEHGITGFEHKGPNGNALLFTSRDRRTKAFWNILTDSARRVDVVGWWLTYPVEPISGVMVAQTNTVTAAQARVKKGIRKGSLVDGLSGQLHPPEREAEYFAIVRETQSLLPQLAREVFGEALDSRTPQVASLFEDSLWVLRADAVYAEIGRRLAREHADLLAIYLSGTDVVGHRFWRYREPDRYAHPPPPEEVAQLREVIADYYAYIDRSMAAILAEAGDDVRVIVISDHGMEADRTDALYPPDARGKALISGNHWHPLPGVFVAAGPGIVRTGRLPSTLAELPGVGSVFDVLPTLLALLDLPLGQDMRGQPMEAVIEPSVLAGRRAAAIPSHDTPEWRSERARLAAEPPPSEDAERIEQLRALGYLE